MTFPYLGHGFGANTWTLASWVKVQDPSTYAHPSLLFTIKRIILNISTYTFTSRLYLDMTSSPSSIRVIGENIFLSPPSTILSQSNLTFQLGTFSTCLNTWFHIAIGVNMNLTAGLFDHLINVTPWDSTCLQLNSSYSYFSPLPAGPLPSSAMLNFGVIYWLS
jgi:hypothetical protein